MQVTVHVYNTLTRRKELLEPREPGKIAMYVCGVTVYNDIHIGNARAFMVFDVIRRYLTWRGFDVTFAQNYTDVDDKIIAKAAEEGRSAEEVAKHYAAAFEEVMAALGVMPPDILVRATDHIEDMIKTISRLIEVGAAYESAGNVWFRVESFPGYGKLSGRSLDDVRAGERVEPDPSKKSPLDFALWKAAKAGEPAWSSPWGDGRPGWHIECSVMSLKYLGMGFDIHGGGSDLIFPHHENEIAQAETAEGTSPFVRYWLHNGMVNLDSKKMSKSLGNVILLKDLLKEVPSQVLRLLAIGGHYRSDVDFGPDQLTEARRTFERFDIFLRYAGQRSPIPNEQGKEFVNKFTEAMDDDFNTPVALSVIHDLVRHGNALSSMASEGDDFAAEELAGLVGPFVEMTGVLGITPSQGRDASSEVVGRLVDLLIEIRDDARKAGRFDESDSIRARLQSMGISLEDTAGGTRWRWQV